MKVIREYCDICWKEIANEIEKYHIDFSPITLTKTDSFQTCRKCQKNIRNYIKERKIEHEIQN